ncbi:glucose-6-phosphate 1-dehydrogenase [Spinactinospora alkalitolerans]|uniref:Glucose-6-phosphate 1-dehydrogenase n=1 Tax=Spinactinospora alkalitolerans TaxID=687207 RepID=A0A852TVR5_9ACTN|nr:glucose-6-phosphate dehydrogenase [Spinactinospora alkalitolerans]NYE45980.1 glucose-6-phosphate 1-dehydrogenase [Spinactinospora alkalitolerans]
MEPTSDSGAGSGPAPQVFVLFGATGDLARRKLFPALFHLDRAGLLPETRIVASGQRPRSEEDFRDHVCRSLEEFAPEEGDARERREFAAGVSYRAASTDNGADLASLVRRTEEELGEDAERLLYLSVPPSVMEPMVRMIAKEGFDARARLVVEKPFGTDLASARELDAAIHDVMEESRVFRIDHFLGKEAVQNILTLRFASGLFEPVWNRHHVGYVQIDVPEEIGLEGRAGFYEATGAFKDMVSTHLFQLLSFVALEPPARLTAEALRDEKTKVFESLRPLDPDRVVFGQYEGYREEEGVDPRSTAETFVALEARVDNWRWSGVPFLLRTGKALRAKRRTITVGFHGPPLKMFDLADEDCEGVDELVFELTDEPEITIEVRAKRPGPDLDIAPARFVLDFARSFAGTEPLEAYERLLLDVMRGDPMLFTRADGVERLWEVCDPVLREPPEPIGYPQGSWGPEQADALAAPRGWRVSRD